MGWAETVLEGSCFFPALGVHVWHQQPCCIQENKWWDLHESTVLVEPLQI